MGKRPAVIEGEGMGMNIYDDGNGECNYAAYTRDFPGAQHSVSHLILRAEHQRKWNMHGNHECLAGKSQKRNLINKATHNRDHQRHNSPQISFNQCDGITSCTVL